jgi:hypothetical protein
MNRRTFLCGLTLGTLSALAAEAQPAKVSRRMSRDRTSSSSTFPVLHLAALLTQPRAVA